MATRTRRRALAAGHGGRAGRVHWPIALAAVVAGLAAPLPAAAELVLLTDGTVFKVDAFASDGEQAELTLPSGGVVRLAAVRVDRVLDDEVEPEPAPGEQHPPAAVIPAVALRFDAAQHQMPIVPYGELIFATAQRHQVNPELVAAVVRAESAFDRTARSYKGARGLMQLMPATAERFGVRLGELYDPARNLDAGVRYLSWLIDRFPGQPELVLASYNAGENAVARHGGVPPYRETRQYVAKILGWLGVTATTVG